MGRCRNSVLLMVASWLPLQQSVFERQQQQQTERLVKAGTLLGR